ncbi:MAG: hypothetical protein P8X39_07600 [Desulfofustis sp.]|jgi:predicted HAD superfamily phosphohydrolase
MGYNNLELNSRQLRGKQSVRATFRLSKQMIDLLKIAANHLGVQQKSLIDELVNSREILDQVASGSREIERKDVHRRQKTFVLSRGTLDLLDEISAKYGIPRDYLVELCISRLVPFVDSEQKKHQQRQRLLRDIERYLADGDDLLKKADEILGRDDRFRIKLEKIIRYTERNVAEMRRFVKTKENFSY